MAKKLEAMTVEELDIEIERLNRERDLLKQQVMVLVEVRDQKVTQEAVQRKFDALSDAEKTAMTQILSVQGIPSGEAVGTPGATK